MAKRDILLVSSNFPPVVGGSAVVYDQLCRQLADRVVALAPRRRYENGEVWPDIDAADADAPYPIHRIALLRPIPSRTGPGRWAKIRALLTGDLPVMARLLFTILVLCVRYGIRTVCLGDLVANGWLVFPLRYLFGLRTVIYTHGEEVLQTNSSLPGRLRGSFLRHASSVISVSLFCKGAIVSDFGVAPDRVFVVPNGVDLIRFNRTDLEPYVPPASFVGKRLILSVSRLVERKGQAQLIAALPDILARVPDVRCLIAGAGPQADALARQVRDLCLDSHVAFLGSLAQDRLASLYRAAELFVLPCRTLADGDTEGFGLVFLEANACGIPVVGGAAGGTVEAIIDSETGLIVDGGDTGDVARAVLALLEDPDLRRRLGDQGWRRAQRSDWASVARRFVAVCRGDMPPERAGLADHSRSQPANADDGVATTQATGEENAAPHLLVTVDVEEAFDWSRFSRTDYQIDGVDELGRFAENCARLRVSPVLLATYPMLAHTGYRELFRDLRRRGLAEIGIHLHGWTSPPHWEHVSAFNSYQCNLPGPIEARKLDLLCRHYEDALGAKPRIHRAGRWGASSRTLELLEALGIDIDLSLSSGLDDTKRGGPDFTRLDGTPLWLGKQRRVLAIPATSVEYLRGPGWVSDVYFAHRRRRFKPVRALTSLVPRKPIRFTPEGLTTPFLQRMAGELKARSVEVAVFTLHSTSLYAGGSPYARDKGEAAALQDRAIDVIRYCVETLDYRPASCADLYRAAAASRGGFAAAAE